MLISKPPFARLIRDVGKLSKLASVSLAFLVKSQQLFGGIVHNIRFAMRKGKDSPGGAANRRGNAAKTLNVLAGYLRTQSHLMVATFSSACFTFSRIISSSRGKNRSISIFRSTRFRCATSLELNFSLKTSGTCSNGSWKSARHIFLLI